MGKASSSPPTVVATVKDGLVTSKLPRKHGLSATQLVSSARNALSEATARVLRSGATAGGTGVSLARKPVGPSADVTDGKYGLRSSPDGVGIRYVLECYRDGQPYFTMPLPNQPAFKHVAKRPGVSVRYTLGESPVRELTEPRMWTLSFGGMSGSASRGYPAAMGSEGFRPGVQALIQFDTFLSNYQQLAQTDGYAYLRDSDKHLRLYDRTYLLLHDFDEGYVYRVEVQSFDWSRDQGTRVGNADWRLTLHAYRFEATTKSSVLFASAAGSAPELRLGQYISPRNKAFVQALSRATEDRELSPKAAQGLVERLKARDGCAALLEPASTTSMTAAVRKAVQAVIEPLRKFQQKVDDFRNATAEAVDIARLPLTFCAEVIRSGDRVLSLLRDVRDAGMDYTSDVTSLSQRVFNIHQDAETAVRALSTIFGNLRGPVDLIAAAKEAGKEGDALSLNITKGSFQSSDPQFPNVVVHVVQAGETWQDIAMHYHGTPETWTTLAAWNKAKGAYDGPTGGPLLPGSFVKVPGVLGSPSAGAVGSVKKPTDFYGTDLAFDFKAGDLMLDALPYVVYDGVTYNKTDPDKKDFALVSGVDNFKQALLHRLLTPRGEVPFLPNYGLLPVHVGDAITDEIVAQVLVTMSTNLQQDPRVLKVANATIEFDGDSLLAQFDVVGLTGGQIGVAAPIL